MILRRVVRLAAIVTIASLAVLVTATEAHAQAPRSTAGATPIVRVPVASRAIARGATLSAADIMYASGDSTIAPVAATPADTLVGWMTRRLISAGETLRAPAVVPPQLVKSGDAVDVIYEDAGVRITMRGRATRSAALGERLVIRLDTQRKVEGTVVAPGQVRVN